MVTRICFSVPAYPLFNPTAPEIFGGSELRAYLFGTGLAKYAEYAISFVVPGHGQNAVEQYGRVKVYQHSYYRTNPKHHRWASALERLSKVFQTQAPSLFIGDYEIVPQKIRVYREVNADIYCVFGVSNFAAELLVYCQDARKRFVLFAGSDQDFSKQYYAGSSERNPYGSTGDLCYQVLMRADCIITQTNHQAQLLQERFRRDAVIIYNPIDLAPLESEAKKTVAQKFVLWIGKSDQVKRPEILLQLARNFPDIQFVMVLNRANPEIFEQISRQVPANIRLIERTSLDQSDHLFSQASVLVNTSVFEGFPNTFLQAGKYGVPILSLEVNPDGFIENHGCGIVANGNMDRFVAGLQRLTTDSFFYAACAQNVQSYVATFHEREARIAQLHNVLQGLLANGS